MTSAKTSVKSIPEELAEQQNSKHPINARKESGASAQTSASAQIWDPNENSKNQTTSFYPYDYFKPLYEPSLKPKRSCGLKKTFETNKGGLISEGIFTSVPFSKKCAKSLFSTFSV